MATLANLSSPDCLYYPFTFCGAWFFPTPVHLELCLCMVQWVLYPSRGQDPPANHAVLIAHGTLLALWVLSALGPPKKRGLCRDAAVLGGEAGSVCPGAERLASASL